jgi:2-polyprenyl-6-hydroxyphenyl methylase/3-demethylubiquinone-9 3-methyltransferase
MGLSSSLEENRQRGWPVSTILAFPSICLTRCTSVCEKPPEDGIIARERTQRTMTGIVMRTISREELCHERLGDEFEHAISQYDTQRRVEILVDEFLSPAPLAGLRAIDVGCGLGMFSKRLCELGADVTACDLGSRLVERASSYAGCQGVQADCMALADTFGEESFDIVVSSECIEHTPDPQEAVRQMFKILRPGGRIALSTPNVLWWPVVRMATVARIRPFDGLENFSSWRGLRRLFRQSGIQILREQGLHAFPFQFGAHRLSRWIDCKLQVLRPAMINICLLGKKIATGEHQSIKITRSDT